MTDQLLYALPLLVPFAFALLGMAFFAGLEPREQARRGILTAAFLPGVLALASIVLLAVQGPDNSPTWGMGDVGLSVHLDALSATMLLLVSFLGAVVLGFSIRYLDGDPRHRSFLGQLCLTLASVSLLVIAGNLYQLFAAWVAMSISLHGLLLFRRERAGAQLAARKKFALARIGDVALFTACALIIWQSGTADLTALSAWIGQQPTAASGLPLAFAAGLIALAAVLKSAQFPTHGWLVEVMETPTPVSALLHAGIVNAGGFLLLRFADLMLLFPAIMLSIAALGALTAVFGSLVMLTQTNQKGLLAYSTVSQMGFMLFQCGLGAFAAAGLHLVGHSLYKAYAFLASGTAVAEVRDNRPPALAAAAPVARGARLGLLLAGAVVYVLLGNYFGTTWQTQPVVFTLGAVFMLGIWIFLASGLGARDWTAALALRVIGGVALTGTAYFALQAAAARILANAVPATVPPGAFGQALLALVLLLFLALAVAQVLPAQRWSRLAGSLRIHAARGFYVNLLINRLIGAYRYRGARNA